MFYMTKNWHKYIKSDPYYNPNLSLNSEKFEISINQNIKIDLRSVNVE